MGYLWTKYLKLRFLGLVPLFPDLTRWLGTAALKLLHDVRVNMVPCVSVLRGIEIVT